MEISVLRTDHEGYVYVMVQSPRWIGPGAIVGKAEELDHVVEPEELAGKSDAEVECMDGVSLTGPWKRSWRGTGRGSR